MDVEEIINYKGRNNMAKREKYIIWGREPDTKKRCREYIQKLKEKWGVHYLLNDEEIKNMKDLMSNYYYTPLEQAKHLVQGNWQKAKDQIKFIGIKYGPVYFEPRFEFYNMHPNTVGFSTEYKMWNFSVARCICFGGNGMVHESAYPKNAVIESLRNAIASNKLQWKRDQGYSARDNQRKDAHHIDGKEFKTIYLKFLDAIKKTEDEFISMLYPTHGDFENAKVTYFGVMEEGIGWEFKDENNSIRKAWVKFHERNVTYELIDPALHRKITSEEIKFNTDMRNLINETK